IRATSRNCGFRLGELVVARIPESFPGVKVTDLGRYRITEITHTIDDKGLYSNTFCGIPSGTPTMPWGDAVMPVAYPEMARVVSNDDPKNQGRVKVQFMWQEVDGGESYWMRVQSPDAGKSDQIAKNRGFVFIPEPDDLVMVGFEQGNPDRPYVTGSIFYKANSKGAASDNTVKSIQTRSGHTLEFNDDENGHWGITITDKENNIIRLDTKKKSISISAPEKITFESKDVIVSASNNLELIAAKNATLQGDENLVCRTKEMQTEVENEYQLNAKTLTGITEKTEIQSTKDDLLLSSGKEVVTNSKSKKIRLS
uniref:phage baseplate assembly protein V n=2 Tax=uncultured Bacteroides sp. TaxID=162156 RepID=UPI0025DFA317